MDNCSPIEAPIVIGDNFSKSQCPKDEIEENSMKQILHASTLETSTCAQLVNE